MPDQLTFGGFELPAEPPRRPVDEASLHVLFLALLPDETVCAGFERLQARLRRECGLTGTPLPPGRFHVSLQGVGAFETLRPEIVERAMAAAALVSACRFELAFDHAKSVRAKGENYAFVLHGGAGVEEATSLQRNLGLALRGLRFKGIRLAPVPPHLTLSYDAQQIEDFAIEPVRWAVREFVLVHSRPRDPALGWRSRREYSRLGQWTLGD